MKTASNSLRSGAVLSLAAVLALGACAPQTAAPPAPAAAPTAVAPDQAPGQQPPLVPDTDPLRPIEERAQTRP